MKVYQAKYDWMPPVSKVPSRIQRLLLPFTPTVKGWTIWYAGKTRTVCGITTRLEEVPQRWAALKARIDQEAAAKRPSPTGATLREAVSEYFTWLEHRVRTGKPKPMAQITADDYKRHLTAFARFEMDGGKLADLPLVDFGPEVFRAFAEGLGERSPTSFSRIVATVYAFFRYCRDEGLLPAEPHYGRYFVRTPQAKVRDRRLQQQKAWEPRDLWRIVEHATTQEKAWIGLALCGAMDNADIAKLTFDLFAPDGMSLDYRRRKIGRTPRYIPLHPMARQWLDDYLELRPKPANETHAKLVFLTPTGLPLQRDYEGRNKLGNHIDYVAQCWDRLLRRCGLRQKTVFVRVCPICGKPRPVARGTCCGQRKWKRKARMASGGGPSFKGFRSLRTTFANLVPHGFSEERKLIMGHTGDITLEHYIERYGTEHLQKLVEEVWVQAFTAPTRTNQ